jgi:hypothetical protein
VTRKKAALIGAFSLLQALDGELFQQFTKEDFVPDFTLLQSCQIQQKITIVVANLRTIK